MDERIPISSGVTYKKGSSRTLLEIRYTSGVHKGIWEIRNF